MNKTKALSFFLEETLRSQKIHLFISFGNFSSSQIEKPKMSNFSESQGRAQKTIKFWFPVGHFVSKK